MIITTYCKYCGLKIVRYSRKRAICPKCSKNVVKKRFHILKCKICNEEFATDNSQKQTCSTKCQKTPTSSNLGEYYFFRAKNKHKCKRCKNIIYPSGMKTSLHVHHKVPKIFGGNDEESNLICLCVGCHVFVHKHPELNRDFIKIS